MPVLEINIKSFSTEALDKKNIICYSIFRFSGKFKQSKIIDKKEKKALKKKKENKKDKNKQELDIIGLY